VARLFASFAFRTLCRRPGAFDDVLACMLAAGITWGQMKRAIRDRRGAARPSQAAPAVRARR
jgi:hypothetical protein